MGFGEIFLIAVAVIMVIFFIVMAGFAAFYAWDYYTGVSKKALSVIQSIILTEKRADYREIPGDEHLVHSVPCEWAMKIRTPDGLGLYHLHDSLDSRFRDAKTVYAEYRLGGVSKKAIWINRISLNLT